MAIKLMTDSCCDLPVQIVQRYGIELISLTYLLDGKEYPDDLWQTQEAAAFYDRMRAGSSPKTSQVNVDHFMTKFKELVEQGHSVLYLAFSSALSGTANAAMLAQKKLSEEMPGVSVTVIDTKSASMGQGLLVLETAKRLAGGEALSDTVTWLNQSIGHLNHWFTVGDLEYLKRGGRISPLAGTVGTLLQIKPVLRVDDEGRLVPWAKARGRRKALDMLCDLMVQQYAGAINDTVAISHANCAEDAASLERHIRERLQVGEVIVSQIGPVIGSHAGPETLALFFFGDSRG